MRTNWPSLDYAEWQDTCAALHLYMQIVGKYRLAHTPWVNHSWHATFYVTARGVTTSLIPDGPDIEIEFDLVNHLLIGTNGEGRTSSFSLGPMTVAAFHASVTTMIADLDGRPQFDRRPNEVPFPVPFDEDHLDRPYDVDAVRRYHQVLISVDRVFKRFRTSFLGKCSPVHLFWGSFDLAVTRFSGRRAPQHGGGIPALPDRVAQEAYDREVSSAGFWPGGGGFSQPAFYSYAYPAPEGFRNAEVQPAAATWDQGLSEFILPYEAVRSADDGDAALLAFLESTYRAAATLGGWDRELLDCDHGEAGTVRNPDPRP
ncbi:DUF5996 family protein [Sphingomonas silueang]|uniref:DUF5996 family protein n=1 Tax=Sphingomonas silueang TaxID=3156617 RepID=UPI0032B42B02